MTIESSVSDLTTATTALTNAVGVQQIAVTNAVAAFVATTSRVNALANVDNTHDADKPVGTATVAALATKQAVLVSGQNISTVNGLSLLSGTPLVIARSATSLNRMLYEDRAVLRNISAQIDDATMVEGLGLFMWASTQLEPDDDETCFSTLTGQWLLQAPAWELIDAWNLFDASTTDDWREDEPARFAAYILANK